MYYLSLFVSKIYFLPSQEINLSRVACKLYNHNFLAKVTFRRGGRNATIISLSRSTIKSYSIKNRWFLICWRWNNKYEKRFVDQLCNYLFGKRINNSFFFFLFDYNATANTLRSRNGNTFTRLKYVERRNITACDIREN